MEVPTHDAISKARVLGVPDDANLWTVLGLREENR
jgi:hypothetical protein